MVRTEVKGEALQAKTLQFVGWWSRLTGRESRRLPPSVRRGDLLPGRLAMSATEHRLSTAGGALECWSFVSDGLAALGQKELVFTFARQRDESIDPLAGQVGRLLITIHSLAAAGRIVEIGSFTEFGERRFLGERGPRGLAYLRAQPLEGVTLPDRALAAIPLMGDEVETLKHFGMTRVAARLGERYRYYPWPPWWDRDRAVIAAVAGDDASVLRFTPHGVMQGLYVSVEGPGGTLGSHLSIRLLASSRDLITQALDQFPTGSGATLVGEPDPGADALMVWRPGQTEPAVIGLAGSPTRRIAACFLMIVSEASSDSILVREDGVAVLLSNTSLSRVVEALRAARPFQARTENDWTLSVEWMPETYATAWS